jgi:hypothetical protein
MGIFFHEMIEGRLPRNKKTMRKIAGRWIAISALRSCHGFLISDGVHPSCRTGTLPVTPSGRIAAGAHCTVQAWPEGAAFRPLPDHA